ncbi:hypothetical protein GGU11DRAFT_746688 [Lentinula aff. detonsa]|nr:hypothetical protein GGU11DRAFT_746688 [Lentinula aff. detonsa]
MESEDAEGSSEAVKDESAGVKAEGESTTDDHTSSTTPSNSLKSQNVIGDQTSPERSQSKSRPGFHTRSRTRPHAPTLSSMPVLSDLSLHSPSNIVGTPFTVNSVPYEYPFPPNAQSSDAIFPPLTPPSLLSASLSLSGPTVALSTSSPFGPDARSYSPTHPKMRPVDPPVPPGLVKKRQRWSLTLTRRENSFGSQTSEGSTSSGTGTRSHRAFSLDDAPPTVPPQATLSERTSSGKTSPVPGTADDNSH